MIREVTTRSEEETERLGRRLGRLLAAGDVVGLTGPLGVGKTCLVRGMAQGLEVPGDGVRSPSFTLISTHRGGRLPLHHIDLFRMDPTPIDRLALREYLYGDGVCAIEWIERLGEDVAHLAIELEYADSNERRIRLRGGGDRYVRLVQALGEWA